MIQGSARDKSDHVSLLWGSSIAPKPAHNQVYSPSEGFPSVGECGCELTTILSQPSGTLGGLQRFKGGYAP